MGYFNTLTPEHLSAIGRKGALAVNASRSPEQCLALAIKASRAAAAALAAKKKGQATKAHPKQNSNPAKEKSRAEHSTV
jgi:hypothetical protein